MSSGATAGSSCRRCPTARRSLRDALAHDYLVRAVDDDCSQSTDSTVASFADGVACVVGDTILTLAGGGAGGAGTFDLSWLGVAGVDGYNLYLGTIDSLRTGRVYDHAKILAGATYPDSSTPADGCDVSGGLTVTGRVADLPAGTDVYLLLVASNAAGEGPYGARSDELDRHDPLADPRGATFFCH